jgi:hypothetical protein
MRRGPLTLALALACAAALPGRGQTPPVFRARVEAVYVDVFVTRSGQPVPGLRASDFELRDNGVTQQVDLLSAEALPVLAVLVFDTSSSMEGERLAALRAAGEAFLSGLGPADQVSLVAFSERISTLAEPTTDKAVVREALGSLRAAGATSVFDALFSAITLSVGGPGRTSVARRWFRAGRRRNWRCATSPRHPAATSGERTRQHDCRWPSPRWPTRCATATSYATRQTA